MGMSAFGRKHTFAVQQPMSALPPKADICTAIAHVRFGPKADISALAKIPKFLAANDKTKVQRQITGLSNFGVSYNTVPKKNRLRYELYGSSSAGGNKGHWRWAIFAGQEKRPMQVGSFYGSLRDAKQHAEAAISRLKERARNRNSLPTK
jgi:hypothetical protein